MAAKTVGESLVVEGGPALLDVAETFFGDYVHKNTSKTNSKNLNSSQKNQSSYLAPSQDKAVLNIEKAFKPSNAAQSASLNEVKKVFTK